jgi:tetratricopeptide (TPR) repeat protein
LGDQNHEHLTADELEEWLSGAMAVPPDRRSRRESHVSSCPECQLRITMLEDNGSILNRLPGRGPGVHGPACPEASEWPLLAAGLVRGARAQELLDHAANCDACGGKLRAAAECFSDELSEEEETLISGLATSSPQRQKQMAATMSALSARHGERRRFGPRAWLAIAASFAIGALALTWWMAGGRTTRTAELLARAYSERRPFDLRIPGAGYAPVRVERGGDSGLNRPTSLLEAELQIQKEIARNPDSPEWLELRARAEMLDQPHGASAAIETLRRAHALRPNDPAIEADLGSAYALSASLNSRPKDYEQAVEFLGRSLQRRPADAVTLFNRAVVYEQMNVYNLAMADWKRYLELDRSSAWANEAAARLDVLTKKKEPGKRP